MRWKCLALRVTVGRSATDSTQSTRAASFRGYHTIARSWTALPPHSPQGGGFGRGDSFLPWGYIPSHGVGRTTVFEVRAAERNADAALVCPRMQIPLELRQPNPIPPKQVQLLWGGGFLPIFFVNLIPQHQPERLLLFLHRHSHRGCLLRDTQIGIAQDPLPLLGDGLVDLKNWHH